MARIAGIDIPQNKRIEAALASIYGVGHHNVTEILTEANVDPNTRSQNLTAPEIASITRVLEHYTLEGELRKQVRDNIERLKHIGSYRGARHNANLPVHGQRTRTNARTKRGKRVTVGALKKEEMTRTEQQTKEPEASA